MHLKIIGSTEYQNKMKDSIESKKEQIVRTLDTIQGVKHEIVYTFETTNTESKVVLDYYMFEEQKTICKHAQALKLEYLSIESLSSVLDRAFLRKYLTPAVEEVWKYCKILRQHYPELHITVAGITDDK
ncbi:MAG: hypothetical protein U9Q15_01295 [Patescibacteria group bacterium]|nr:hypothetical protein [Patescibacteria group bacterium]